MNFYQKIRKQSPDTIYNMNVIKFFGRDISMLPKLSHEEYLERWDQENKEKRKEYKKEYREKNKEKIAEKNKEKIAEKNKEKIAKKQKSWIEEMNEWEKDHYEKHKEKIAENKKKFNTDYWLVNSAGCYFDKYAFEIIRGHCLEEIVKRKFKYPDRCYKMFYKGEYQWKEYSGAGIWLKPKLKTEFLSKNKEINP